MRTQGLLPARDDAQEIAAGLPRFLRQPTSGRADLPAEVFAPRQQTAVSDKRETAHQLGSKPKIVANRWSPSANPAAIRLAFAFLAMTGALGLATRRGAAQAPVPKFGEVVPRDVREIYDRGLQYLAAKQTEKGDWPGGGYEDGPGPVGLGLMVFLASGEDPNFGLYSNHVRRSLRTSSPPRTARPGSWGRACTITASPCSAWPKPMAPSTSVTSGPTARASRSIGQALELAVRAAVTSQKKNSLGAWRYSPDATDADTSVSGAVLVGLLRPRNAGIEVPDAGDRQGDRLLQANDRSAPVRLPTPAALADSTSRSPGSRSQRSSIAVSRRKDLAEYKASLNSSSNGSNSKSSSNGRNTRRYYQAQASVPGRYRGLGEMEQAADAAAKASPEARWQLSGPVRPQPHDVVLAPGAGPQLSFSPHLRTVDHALHVPEPIDAIRPSRGAPSRRPSYRAPGLAARRAWCPHGRRPRPPRQLEERCFI